MKNKLPRLRWRPIQKDPRHVSTENLREILKNNRAWIAAQAKKLYRQNQTSTMMWEVRYNELLTLYAQELLRREGRRE